MTLPTNIILPLHTDRIESGDPKELGSYIRDLVFELQTMYERLADNINGSIRADYDITQSSWEPTLKGSTTVGNFTYEHQTGYSLRRGLMVDVWFDVEWSATGGAAGNLVVNLPYQVANVSTSSTFPFVGICQPSNITFTAGTDLVINAMPNTFDGEVWYTGDGVATGNQLVVASGRLIGHIRYIGQQDEREN